MYFRICQFERSARFRVTPPLLSKLSTALNATVIMKFNVGDTGYGHDAEYKRYARAGVRRVHDFKH